MSTTTSRPVSSSGDVPAKSEPQCLEKNGAVVDGGDGTGLFYEHREYLLQRHGTIDLDPIPSMDPADPYNWPLWKACTAQRNQIKQTC